MTSTLARASKRAPRFRTIRALAVLLLLATLLAGTPHDVAHAGPTAASAKVATTNQEGTEASPTPLPDGTLTTPTDSPATSTFAPNPTLTTVPETPTPSTASAEPRPTDRPVDGVVVRPPNDDFSKALAITNMPWSGSVQLKNATSAADDPAWENGNPDGKTVWYRFTPSRKTTVEFTADAGNDYVDLSVFKGSRGSLKILGTSTNRLVVTIPGGLTVHIEVAERWQPVRTAVSLVFRPVRPAANDVYGKASVITLENSPVSVDATYASWSPSDPYFDKPDYSVSVWFKFQAPQTGTFAFSYQGSEYESFVGAFTGSPGAWGNLNSSSAGIKVFLTAGQTIALRISPRWENILGRVELRVWYADTPANDDIRNAIVVGPLPWSWSMDTSGATCSADDPHVGKYTNSDSLWFKFTPTQSAYYTITAARSDPYRLWLVAVYAGRPGALIPVAEPDLVNDSYDPADEVYLKAGTTYYILVENYYSGGTGGSPLVLDVKRYGR